MFISLLCVCFMVGQWRYEANLRRKVEEERRQLTVQRDSLARYHESLRTLQAALDAKEVALRESSWEDAITITDKFGAPHE